MDPEYEESVLSILEGRKGWDEELSSLSEFKRQLEEADVAQQNLTYGWVLWKESGRQSEQQQIITLHQNFASEYCFRTHYLVQYWGVVKVEGRNHYLSTSNYPFSVGRGLRNGHCWYRKRCKDHIYVVDVDDDEEQIGVGGVGRVYRKKKPESTPDLRLYPTNEFPMRDEAARCGFRGYMALPLFLPHTNHQCYGVLEVLSDDTIISRNVLSAVLTALQIAGFEATHSSISTVGFATRMPPQKEIKETIELAMATVPRLYLAQVWLPCQQCANINTNLCCMQIASFITSQNSKVNLWNHVYDTDINDYLEACEFHHLQIELGCLDSSVGNLSISKNPLAHYAQRARTISHSFAVSLQSVNYTNNHSYVVKFFFQPKKGEDDANGDNSLQLLSSIMEMSLKSFRFVPGGKLVSELPQQPNAIDCESTDSLDVMKSYKQKLSQSNFTTYLEMVDSYSLKPFLKDSRQGWVFGISNNSLLVPLPIKENIENFMKKIQVNWTEDYWIIQFWAPKTVENRYYLEAFDQPYVVGCLSKGLASFRKKCMTHSYFVDDEAKEEELGPPGRVFRNGHPEISPDLFHYTTEEYPIRKHAMHCCILSRGYFSFPIFEDEHNHKCVGVLEFVGFCHLDLKSIEKTLKAAKLCSTHTDLYQQAFNTIRRRKALTEVHNALRLICKTPQLFMANVWIPNGECVTGINSNKSCMEFALSSRHIGKCRSAYQVQWIHVETGKGMVGTVLASEIKSCFFRKTCEFSIVDQPLSHFEISKRCEVCFAICLQSSHTSELLYLMEFFLYQGPTTYEYLRSFLNFLLPIMKHELKSFKMASGKELGEELVVEVIEFSDANKLDSSDSEQTDMFPIRFKSVQYSQKEHQREECSVAASDSKTRERGKRKTGVNLNLEVLEPHFGKKLKDVAQELGIGRSTIKRACRDYGIDRWPTKKQYKNNSSLFEFEGESGRVLSDQQHTNIESTHHAIIVEEKAEKVIIKVKYEEDVIKFEFSLSLGSAKLFEQVAKELNLKLGTFKLKYMDEDKDQILLTRGADLHLCPKSQTATGRTCIQFFLQLVSK